MQRSEVHCDDCHTIVPEFTTRQIDSDLYEVGLDCPSCHRWYHSYYENKWLRENKPSKFDSNKANLKYAVRFRKFQKEIKSEVKSSA